MKLQMSMPKWFKLETANGQSVVLPFTAVVDLYIESPDTRTKAKLMAAHGERELQKHPEYNRAGFEFKGFSVGNDKRGFIVVTDDQFSEMYTALDALFSTKREGWPSPWILSDDEIPEKRQLTYKGHDVTICAYSDGE